MHKWIGGTVCAAAALSVSVAAAQTYPQTPENQPTTKSAPTRSSSSARTPRQVTMTGCLMRGTGAQSTRWVLSNATTTQGPVNEATVGTSRSGSPSNEGIGVSGSTSTAIGTSGTNNPTASIDTEAHGGGTAGATDRNGSTVGAGATAAVTEESPNAASYQLTGVRNPTQYVNKRVEVVGTMSTTGNNASHMLRVTSVRLLGDTCQ
jgi:hypothetical protein